MNTSLADIQHELRPELGPGERLLWSGMPRQGVVFRPIDLFLIPFVLLWAGIPTLAALGLLNSGRGAGIGDLFFLPFILVGAYLLVGRFIVDAKQRARTFYGVTNQRILIVRTWWRRRTTSLKLGFLPDVTLTEGRNGRGAIQFGPDRWPGAGWFGGGWPGNAQAMSPRFDLAENVRAIYDTIIRAQADLSRA
jgi:hypothetical protein